MSHSLTNLLYHILFSTKERQPFIRAEIESRVYQYLGGIIRGQQGSAIEINGMPDHVHILARLSQNIAVADVLRKLKGDSSGWIHRRLNLKSFAWQVGYAAFTVSESQVERVRQYIRNQKKHHRRMTFREELIALLKAHKIEFDEESFWR
jgi:REP element-mobilizing transposase RayT